MPSCPSGWGRFLFQASLPWLMSWSRGPRVRATGASLHTGAVLKALSAGGVSGSTLYNAPCRQVATPTLRQGSSSSRSSLLFFSNLKRFLEIFKFGRSRQSPNRCPHKLQKRSSTSVLSGLLYRKVSPLV